MFSLFTFPPADAAAAASLLPLQALTLNLQACVSLVLQKTWRKLINFGKPSAPHIHRLLVLADAAALPGRVSMWANVVVPGTSLSPYHDRRRLEAIECPKTRNLDKPTHDPAQTQPSQTVIGGRGKESLFMHACDTASCM